MIVLRLKGGLGNQMFQYARGRVLSIKNNQELVLDLSCFKNNNFTVREYSLDKFDIKAKILKENKIPFLIKYFLLVFKKIHWNKNIYLEGYFQSENYFKEYSDIIRSDFICKNKSSQAELLIKDMQNCNSVCLHVRRGDYVGHNLHPVQDISYYKNAILELEKKIKIDKIYIYSDDIAWCKENINFNYELIFINKEALGVTDTEELSLMTNCKYFIIANSSFSWWAAWLAINKDKIVVAPQKWFNDTNRDTSDLIPKEWIRL